MVLFCLLWFLNTGQLEEEGSALVDSSIGLLQLSFYSTLIAFMTGVYVTILQDIQWLAIFTCILCSAVLLLMRKRFILYFAYVFRVLFILLELGAFLLGACGKLIAHSLKSRCWSQANRPWWAPTNFKVGWCIYTCERCQFNIVIFFTVVCLICWFG